VGGTLCRADPVSSCRVTMLSSRALHKHPVTEKYSVKNLQGIIARLGLAALVSVAFLGSCISGAKAVGTIRVAPCSSAQLLIGPMNKGLGAATGHSGRWYRIRLKTGNRCSLRGFPSVELLDTKFRRVPSLVKRGGYIISAQTPVRRVILNRNHDAYFAIEDTYVPSPPRPCLLIPWLKVTPPGNTRAILTRGDITLCPGPDGVSPVEPAPTLK
jgi:Protein of unknown function (DUF4232)